MDPRVRVLSSGSVKKRTPLGPVVFWMSRDQRADDHWGLLYARQQAGLLNTHVVVVFFLVPEYLMASQRHYRFLLRGLGETAVSLGEKGIPFYLYQDQPQTRIPHLIREWQVPLLVTDFNPLHIKKQWEQAVMNNISCPFHQVDSHNIVPCWAASPKLEYAAHTFRPKIHHTLAQYLTDFPELEPQQLSRDWDPGDAWLSGLDDEKEDRWYPESGSSAARRQLEAFLDEKLSRYGTERNNPLRNSVSGLSPYLHFGQISAQRIALEVFKAPVPREHRDAFLEELIVRRELSDNFCHYQKAYHTTAAFPPWAMATLTDHQSDQRDYLYSRDELAAAQTHDPLWNAAQMQMKISGGLHGYLRMYWAKKILEWSPDAATAQDHAICLNDTYFLDGRDPNGYAGIAWSIGGVHDRAWPERKIFGKIRYMNQSGCRRKFDVDAYVEQVETMRHQPDCPYP